MWKVFLLIGMLIMSSQKVLAEEMDLSAKSAVLMEGTTGTILFEKESDAKLPPASVTKVMTLLLIFQALDEERISLDEEVTTSEYAASMGGSQVFLEPGETQSVDTLIKCIVVASANDACVVMAERIAGSEEKFVEQMNQMASNLGMEHTTFKNCNGLDTKGHLTTAKDISIMTRELILKYPSIFDYTKIWMEEIEHKTRKGTTPFTLTNTNKLIRYYEYATGLKTGSTSEAGFCLSATAEKEGVPMIAVVMGEPDSKTRMKDCIRMLEWGFSNCMLYKDADPLPKNEVAIEGGKKKMLKVEIQEPFRYVFTKEFEQEKIEKKLVMIKNNAPIKKGEKIGEIQYFYKDRNQIGQSALYACETVQSLSYQDVVYRLLRQLISAESYE